MKKIGLFWGSNTGNQEEATNFLTDYMKSEGYEIDDLPNIKVKASKICGMKCQRCWKYEKKLINDEICQRCNDAIN